MEKVKSSSHYYWVILACGLLLAICNMGNTSLMNASMPFIRDKIGISYAQSSMISTLRQVTIVLATLVMDKVFGKLGVRFGAMIAFACAISSALLFGVATNYPMLLVGGTLSGIAFGLGGMMPAAILMKNWFVKKRGFAVGICAAGSGITSMVMARPLAVMMENNGVFYGQQVWTCIMAVGAVLFFLLVRDNPKDKGLQPYGEGEALEEAKENAKKKIVAVPKKPLSNVDWVMLYSAIFCFGVMGFSSWPNFTLAATNVGYERVLASTMVSLYGMLMMIGKPTYGAVADRFGAPVANYAFISLVALAHVFFAMMNGTSMSILYSAVILMGFCGMAITTVGYPVWTADLVDSENYTKTLKKLQAISTTGGLVTNPLPGILADRTGSYSIGYMCIAAMLVYALIVIQVMYKRFVKKPAVKV